jgi:hypothetical protein
LFSNGGGIQLEHCALVDDKRACALEYNVVRWGETDLAPEAGVAVYVRGETGKLAATTTPTCHSVDVCSRAAPDANDVTELTHVDASWIVSLLRSFLAPASR